MSTEPSGEEILFALALSKPAAKRAVWLDAECDGDSALRQRLEWLLKSAGDSNQPFMRAPAVPDGISPIAEGPKGTLILPVKTL